MTQPMWGPDGQWLGRAVPPGLAADAPSARPDPARPFRLVGSGCLVVVALVLLLPALALGAFSAISALEDDEVSAVATVVAVAPGVDDDGRDRPYCFTVEYDADRTRRHHTCDTLSVPKTVIDPATGEREWETDEAQQRRFARDHPVGSRVKLLYEKSDPGRVEGPISTTSTHRSGGGPVATWVSGGTALLLVGASGLLLRLAWRWVKRRAA